MSLIDLASLVLAPTATKEGKVYSAIPDTGEGDMTFTRGSAATRVNSEGLIEKERGNLLLQSNTFDTTWVNNLGGAITGGQSGYDGSNDAWEINKNTTSFRRLEQSVSVTGIWTFSVYAKAGTREEMALRDGTSGDRAEFNLDSGTIINNGGGTIIERNMTDVGGGWYRCSITCNSTNTLVQIYIDWNETIGGNIYIQDAMLNQGLVSTDYIETTTTAVYEGITDDVPRVDYSGGGCPGLLLEPQRSNLVPQSEYFGAWNLDGGTQSITTNYAISPEGVQNATRLQLNKTGVTYSRLYADAGSLGQATISVYMKSNTSETQNVGLRYDNTGINCEVNTEWQRFDLTATSTSVSRFQILLFDSIAGNDETADILIYGAMLESSVTYASSYLPTYGTSTTRVADACSKTGISELIGQTEGTLFYEYNSNISIDDSFFLVADDGSANNRIVLYSNDTNKLALVINTGGSLQVVIPNISLAVGTNKFAVGYANNDVVLYLNGTQVGSDNTATIPSTSALRMATDHNGSDFASGKGTNQVILFPTRLTNDQLEELTK